MRYMVIETNRGGVEAVYERFRERGRMMPDGLTYIDSWVESNFERCFQLMEASDPKLFAEWTKNWDDIVDFEIIPVMSSEEAREIV